MKPCVKMFELIGVLSAFNFNEPKEMTDANDVADYIVM